MFVYKYVFNEEVIYVGITKDLESRLSQHGRYGDNIGIEGWEEINQSKIFYVKVANEVMADVIESELIRFYKPKYNKAKKSKWCGLPFIEKELVWKEFKKNNFNKTAKKGLKRVINFHEKNTLKEIIKELKDEDSIFQFIYSNDIFSEKELDFIKKILFDINKKLHNNNLNEEEINKTRLIVVDNFDNISLIELEKVVKNMVGIIFSACHNRNMSFYSFLTGHFTLDRKQFALSYQIKRILEIKEKIEDTIQKYPEIIEFY